VKRLPLVFVHGAGGVGRGWDLQVLAFPWALAPDLPGHGSEPGPACGRIVDYAAWLHSLLHGRRVTPAVLAGHSMGGAVALQYALDYPEDVLGLVLIATGPRLRVAPQILADLRRDYPSAVRGIVGRSLAPGASPRLAARLVGTMGAVPPEVTLADFEACDAFDVSSRLEEVRAAALVIVGDEDRMTPLRLSATLSARLPRAELVVIPGAGHMVHAEKPQLVNRAIARFLDRMAASPGPGVGQESPPAGRNNGSRAEAH
jgi:pimeloyl-ACP methyl ester carboxylesterase